MLEALAKDQFVDAVHDDDIRLRIAQSRPTTLRQALEIALELESFVLANKRRSRYVREVRIDEPPYGSTSQVGPWNGVLDLLVNMYSNEEEVRELQSHPQRNVGHVVEITFREIVLITSRKGEIADETGMTTFGILEVTPAREDRITVVVVWRISAKGTIRLQAMDVIKTQVIRETGVSWISQRSGSSNKR